MKRMSAAAYIQTMRKGGPRRKYGNKKVKIDGRTFDSVAEANRWGELNIRQRIGEICELECQPRYDIIINGTRVAFMKLDFRYRIAATGAVVVEDVKSPVTATDKTYRLKKKIVEAMHGIVITEILRR